MKKLILVVAALFSTLCFENRVLAGYFPKSSQALSCIVTVQFLINVTTLDQTVYYSCDGTEAEKETGLCTAGLNLYYFPFASQSAKILSTIQHDFIVKGFELKSLIHDSTSNTFTFSFKSEKN